MLHVGDICKVNLPSSRIHNELVILRSKVEGCWFIRRKDGRSWREILETDTVAINEYYLILQGKSRRINQEYGIVEFCKKYYLEK
jgi:hypothetical protein